MGELLTSNRIVLFVERELNPKRGDYQPLFPTVYTFLEDGQSKDSFEADRVFLSSLGRRILIAASLTEDDIEKLSALRDLGAIVNTGGDWVGNHLIMTVDDETASLNLDPGVSGAIKDSVVGFGNIATRPQQTVLELGRDRLRRMTRLALQTR